jgi:hypothetical protein
MHTDGAIRVMMGHKKKTRIGETHSVNHFIPSTKLFISTLVEVRDNHKRL